LGGEGQKKDREERGGKEKKKHEINFLKKGGKKNSMGPKTPKFWWGGSNLFCPPKDVEQISFEPVVKATPGDPRCGGRECPPRGGGDV